MRPSHRPRRSRCSFRRCLIRCFAFALIGLGSTLPSPAQGPAETPRRWSPTTQEAATTQPDVNAAEAVSKGTPVRGAAIGFAEDLTPDKGAPPGFTYFDNLATFSIAAGGLLSSESFNEGNVAAGEVAVCSDPYDATTNDACWAPGDIADRLQVASSGNNGVAILGPGVANNDSIVTGADSFAENTLLSFSEGGIFALGLDLASNVDTTLELLLLDDKGTVLASSTLETTPQPSFWGVVSEQPFERLAVVSDNGELLDNVRFGPPPPRLEARLRSNDLCVQPGSNVNGIWEPGEGIRLNLTLSAVGGDFHNVAASFSSPDMGLTSPLPKAGFGDLLSGESRSRPVILKLAPEVACFSTLQLTLQAISDEGTFSFDRLQGVGRLPIAQDLPLALPDDAPAGVASLLQVVTEGTINDLRVQVEIAHPWVGDLELRLTSPAGTTVSLLDRPGVPADTFGCSRDDMDVLFSDAEDEPLEDLCAGNPWFVGTAQPRQPLAAFVGQELAGSWLLTVIDHAPGDRGELVSWRLITEPGLQGQCNPCADSGVLTTVLDIPTLSRWAACVMALLLALLAAHRLSRRTLESER